MVRTPEVFNRFPIFVCACVLLASYGLIAVGPALQNQVGMTAVAVLLLGLPHGALDVLMLNDMGHRLRRYSGLCNPRLIGYSLYLVIVIGAFAFWQALPSIALSLFLIAATWHFRMDWIDFGKAPLNTVISALVVTLPALRSSPQLVVLFEELNLTVVQAQIVALTMQLIAGLTVVYIAAIATTKQLSRKHILIIFFLVLAGVSLPPLLFFIAYFCALHSVIHTLSIKQNCQLTWLAVLKVLRLPMMMTLCLVAIAYLMLPAHNAAWGVWLDIVFMGLFAVTVPHMLLSWVYQTYFVPLKQ